MMQNLYYSLFMICALIFYGQRSEAKNLNSLHRNHLNSTKLKSIAKLDSIKITGKVTDANGTALEGVVITEKNTTNSSISDKDGAYELSAGASGTLVFLKSGFQTKEVPVNNQKEIIVSLLAGEDKPEAAAEQDTLKKEVPDTVAKQVPKSNVQAPTTQAQGTVSGTVSGPSGPLAGVTVQVRGTSVSSSTDQDGKFEIAASPGQTLTFNSVGYAPSSRTVGDSKTLQVTLETETNTIESVQVVAVGYGTMKRATLPTAVSSIGASEIENEVLPSITQAIQGKAGGVQVTQKSGSPGSGINIRVRGTTSINASSDPLYVVDGIPVNSTTNFTGGSSFELGGGTQGINVLASINPSDVQSIEILKDAASSSIYGSRAANGVVLITTKKGVAGKSEFNFNMYEGFSNVPRERYHKMMNTTQYQDYMTDMYKYVKENNPNATIPDQIFANPDVNTDWQDAIFRTTPTRSYELSASGGSEKTQYYTSVGYMRQGGVLLNSDFNRLSGRLNLNHQHNEKLRFAASINLTRAINQRVQEENSKEGPTKNGIFSPPNIGIYDAQGNYAYDMVTRTRENPVAMLELPTNEANTFRALANASAEYSFIPELTLKTSFGTDISFIDETFFMPPIGLRSWASRGGVGARRNTRDQLWINETTLTYDKTVGDHYFNALAGFSVQESRLEFVHGQRSNFPSNDINQLVAGGIVDNANAFPEEWAIASAFARVNYNYLEKYILNLNLRADGSSRFGADNRWAYFPSVAAAWRINQEDFLKDNKTFSDLKLRASWGITGNQNIGNYASRSLYSAGNNYMGVPGFVPNVLGDQGLKWETTMQWNVGTDVGLFNNRISLLADYYHKKTTDLLLGMPILLSSGFGTYFTNAGNIENKGFEFELSSKNLVGEFKWSTSLNMTFNRNKILKLADGVDEMFGGIEGVNRARIGEPLGVFYGYKAVGVNPQTGMIDYQAHDGSVGPPKDNNFYKIGDPNPQFFGGISNNFSYKNFDLSILGQFTYGNDILNYGLANGLEGYNVSSNAFVDWERRWRQPGDITDVPRPTPSNSDNGKVSTRFIQDGSFFRIRNVTFGYTLPESISEKIRMKKLRWYFTVQNAYVFTNYRGFDPEVSSSHGGANAGLIYGYDYGSYPQPRMFTTGFNITF